MARKRKPVIPEPSPRFIKWSAAVAVAMLVAILVFDYATGAKDFAGSGVAQAAPSEED